MVDNEKYPHAYDFSLMDSGLSRRALSWCEEHMTAGSYYLDANNMFGSSRIYLQTIEDMHRLIFCCRLPGWEMLVGQQSGEQLPDFGDELVTTIEQFEKRLKDDPAFLATLSTPTLVRLVTSLHNLSRDILLGSINGKT